MKKILVTCLALLALTGCYAHQPMYYSQPAGYQPYTYNAYLGVYVPNDISTNQAYQQHIYNCMIFNSLANCP